MLGSGPKFRTAGILLGVAAALVGCAGSSATTPASTTASIAPASADATGSPIPTPVQNLPVELVGEWNADLTEYLVPDPLCPRCGEETRLIIHPHGRYVIAGYGGFHPAGTFTVDDAGLITFDRTATAGEGDCGNATYSWELESDELTFTAIEPDPCGRRGEALDGVTYTRAE